jgi:NADH-quinone oxidoreductase subunit G
VCAVQTTNKAGKKAVGNACVTKVASGLVIDTRAGAATSKNNLQKLINIHDERCSTCVANSRCEFRPLVYAAGVENRPRTPPILNSIDTSTRAVVIDPSKCILCARCVRACRNISGQRVLKVAAKGKRRCVQTSNGKALSVSNCVRCGQCTLYCPVGAITERSEATAVLSALQNKQRKVYAAQIDAAAGIAISDAMGLAPGTVSTGRVVSALHQLGFDLVFDSGFGADVNAILTAQELIASLDDQRPFFTSTCPAFLNYVERSRPDLIPQLSTVRSPSEIVSELVKNVLGKSKNWQPDEVCCVSIGSCLARKERQVDAVLTVRELVELVRLSGINFHSLEDRQFDHVYGSGSGSAALYATSGGALEGTLRAAYQILNKRAIPNAAVQKLWGPAARKVAEIGLGSQTIKVAVLQGLAEAMKFLDLLKKGDPAVQGIKAVEVLACPGGCVGGGGAAKPAGKEVLDARVKAVYRLAAAAAVKAPGDNPLVSPVLATLDAHQTQALFKTSFAKAKR